MSLGKSYAAGALDDPTAFESRVIFAARDRVPPVYSKARTLSQAVVSEIFKIPTLKNLAQGTSLVERVGGIRHGAWSRGKLEAAHPAEGVKRPQLQI